TSRCRELTSQRSRVNTTSSRINLSQNDEVQTMSVQSETTTPRPVRLDIAGVALNGDLSLPADTHGLVIFAHGSGSSRHSSRNRAVAEVLQHARLGTLLLDLLTEREELVDITTAEFRFNIPLLADRVVAAIDWSQVHPQTSSLPLGLF